MAPFSTVSSGDTIESAWANAILAEAFEKPASWLIRKNGSYYEAIKGTGASGSGTITYGGSTNEGDATGTDGDSVLQAVVTNADSTNGAKIFLGDCTLTLDSGITLPDRQDLRIVIEGMGSKTWRPSAIAVDGDVWAFNWTRSSGFGADLVIRNLCMYAVTPGTGKGVYVSAPSTLYRVNFEGVYFRQLEQALYCNANASGTWSNSHIKDCHFWGCGKNSSTTPAVRIDDPSLVRIKNSDWTGDSEYQLLYAYQGADVRIHHCRFEGSQTTGAEDLVKLEAVNHSHVDSSTFQWVRTGKAALNVAFGSNSKITNNMFKYYRSGASNTHAIDLPNAHTAFVVENNDVMSDYTFGVRSRNAGSTGKIWKNDFNESITYPVTATSTLSIKYNLGYVNYAMGEATILSGNSSVDIDPGFHSRINFTSTTPYVLVTGQHAEVRDLIWAVKDADEITVTSSGSTTADRKINYLIADPMAI